MIRCFRSGENEEKKMKLECNASKEPKEKGQGDLKSMVKFIPSQGDTKRPPAAERWRSEKQVAAVGPLPLVGFVMAHNE